LGDIFSLSAIEYTCELSTSSKVEIATATSTTDILDVLINKGPIVPENGVWNEILYKNIPTTNSTATNTQPSEGLLPKINSTIPLN
jgi:hypothetical protein